MNTWGSYYWMNEANVCMLCSYLALGVEHGVVEHEVKLGVLVVALRRYVANYLEIGISAHISDAVVMQR